MIQSHNNKNPITNFFARGGVNILLLFVVLAAAALLFLAGKAQAQTDTPIVVAALLSSLSSGDGFAFGLALAAAAVLPVVQTALMPMLMREHGNKVEWEKASVFSPSYPFVVGQRLGKDTCGGVDVRVFENAHSSHELAHCAVHSPTGLNWGYGGSGPADLALSLLCWAALVPAEKEGRNAPISARDYQEFKFDFVGSMPSCWLMTREQIRHWIRKRGGVGVRRVLDAQYVSDGMCGCNGEWVKDGKCTACDALAERPEIPAEVVGLWKPKGE